MADANLIKLVRALDQNGPGDNGQNLTELWNALTASSASQFHAAEESVVRWLLKSMNGSTESAQILRRWPMSWTLLDVVFQRIPLFSLAKSLADRKFLAVLTQTLQDISKASPESSKPDSLKRKRQHDPDFTLGSLQTSDGSLCTARTLVTCLKSLLGRLKSKGTALSHTTLGAEHIRSLFCVSAKDSMSIVSGLISLCYLLAANHGQEISESEAGWITVASDIWDLHLQGNDDTIEIATSCLTSAALLIDRLEGFSKDEQTPTKTGPEEKWSADLQDFMIRNLIIPARASFFNNRDFESMTRAMDVSKAMWQRTMPPLFFFALQATDQLSEHSSRKANSAWMTQIFVAIKTAIQDTPWRNKVMRVIMEQALKRPVPIETAELRNVYRVYVLEGKVMDWSLAASLAQFEPGIFQASGDGPRVLKETCDISIAQMGDQTDKDAIRSIIASILQSFQTARDLTGFLQLWSRQLSSLQEPQALSASAWLEVGRKGGGAGTLILDIEKHMTTQQLLQFLDSMKANGTNATACCVVADTVAQDITSDAFTDAVGDKLFDLVRAVKSKSSDFAPLRWSVLGKTLSWVSSEASLKIWNEFSDEMSKALRRAPIAALDTFEAFKCCGQAWISLMPVANEKTAIAASLVQAFDSRLATVIGSSNILQGDDSIQHGSFSWRDFTKDNACSRYLCWYLRGSSQFLRLYTGSHHVVPKALTAVLSSAKASSQNLEETWSLMIRNETNVNDTELVRRLIDDLTADLRSEEGNPKDRCGSYTLLLNTLPLDTMNRSQRESLMDILVKSLTDIDGQDQSSERLLWKSTLSLITKLMTRPTFYNGMIFGDLCKAAGFLSPLTDAKEADDSFLLELLGRFELMASATVRQMTDHVDERSIAYLKGSGQFISDCHFTESLRSPLFLTLLKVLSLEMARSTACQSHSEISQLQQNAKETLANNTLAILSKAMGDKKFYTTANSQTSFEFLVAVDAASELDILSSLDGHQIKKFCKYEKYSRRALSAGNIKAWKAQILLQKNFASHLDEKRPMTFDIPDDLSSSFSKSLLREYVQAVVANMATDVLTEYLGDLIGAFNDGRQTEGQILAIQQVVEKLLGKSHQHCSRDHVLSAADTTEIGGSIDSAVVGSAHARLTAGLITVESKAHWTTLCRVLYLMLEKRPHAIGQWNVEITLSSIARLAAAPEAYPAASYSWMCKLVEVIIKKHRLRLEGHYHLLLATLEALLSNLIVHQSQTEKANEGSQTALAQMYSRLVTLICEPTAGAVSRSQTGALDSATDVAKRSAGRHMYFLLMQYVKLQLESDVSRATREALEPAMNSIFDITPPEGRKILNDAMDGSGRAILGDMFKRYTRFGKWSGV